MQTPPPGEPLDYQTWERELDRLGDYDPAEWPRVFVWDYRNRLDPESLRKAIHYIWVQTSAGLLDGPGIPKVPAVRPQRLTPLEWNTLFTAAGGYFVIEENCTREGFTGPECEKPTTLYRFSEDGNQVGWSWTATPESAAYFETGFSHEPRHGRLWRVDNVDPDRLLAHFHTETMSGNPTNPQYIGEFILEPHPDEIVPSH